jgi:drug/metabolite transporter (DMT)-like permease
MGSSPDARRPPPSNFGWRFLTPLIIVWYSFSLLAIYTSKVILDSTPCAASLCALQLGAAALGCQIWSRLTPRGKDHDEHGRGPAPLTVAEYGIVCIIALSYSSGFVFTNAAYEFAAPAFVETVKAVEPLSTVALATAILGEREHMLTLCSLVPLVLGVAMASGLGEGHVAAAFSAAGMTLSLASNLSFSARAIATKQLRTAHPSVAAVRSDLVLFYHVSRLGVLWLLPMAGLLDARALVSALIGGSGGTDDVEADGGGGADGHAVKPQVLLLIILVNTASHAAYNAISFAVLNRVSVSSHAVLNIVRRVFMIGGTALILGTPISTYNWLGIAVCVGGCLAFAKGKSGPQPVAARKSAASMARSARVHSV